MNVTYCVIPKAGCTLWLRIFKFLAGQKLSTGTPLSISKFEVHYKELDKYKRFDISNNEDLRFFRNSLRVMTVRDPYTRIWSAYIDKLLLPDFWQTKGKTIIKKTRPNPTPKALKCGNDVTFPEFIQYILGNGHRTVSPGQDNHWLPASDVCDPCIFKPDIIAKQETLLDDLTYVLRHTGRDDLLKKLTTKNHTEFEIEDEINYNFEIARFHGSCASMFEICERMWEAFQLNGYIPPIETFHNNIPNKYSLTERSFFGVIKGIRLKHAMTKEDTKQLRKVALTNAYSSISKEQMTALRDLYRDDFELFDYNETPEYIK